MNCRPGDLAIVVSDKPQYNGRIVEVLHAPPAGEFRLPDGHLAKQFDPRPSWVLKFIGGAVTVPLVGGTTRQTWYGVGADENLRPLRGLPDEETQDQRELVS
jgi:hypothetical protein